MADTIDPSADEVVQLALDLARTGASTEAVERRLRQRVGEDWKLAQLAADHIAANPARYAQDPKDLVPVEAALRAVARDIVEAE